MPASPGVMYLFWLFSSEQLRYLLPILPLLAIAIAASAETIRQDTVMLGRVAAVFASWRRASAGMLTTAAWFCQKAPLRVVLGGETAIEYLARNLDYYPYYQSINTETPPDAQSLADQHAARHIQHRPAGFFGLFIRGLDVAKDGLGIA